MRGGVRGNGRAGGRQSEGLRAGVGGSGGGGGGLVDGIGPPLSFGIHRTTANGGGRRSPYGNKGGSGARYKMEKTRGGAGRYRGASFTVSDTDDQTLLDDTTAGDTTTYNEDGYSYYSGSDVSTEDDSTSEEETMMEFDDGEEYTFEDDDDTTYQGTLNKAPLRAHPRGGEGAHVGGGVRSRARARTRSRFTGDGGGDGARARGHGGSRASLGVGGSRARRVVGGSIGSFVPPPHPNVVDDNEDEDDEEEDEDDDEEEDEDGDEYEEGEEEEEEEVGEEEEDEDNGEDKDEEEKEEENEEEEKNTDVHDKENIRTNLLHSKQMGSVNKAGNSSDLQVHTTATGTPTGTVGSKIGGAGGFGQDEERENDGGVADLNDRIEKLLPTESQLVLLCLDYLRHVARSYTPEELRDEERLNHEHIKGAVRSLDKAFLGPPVTHSKEEHSRLDKKNEIFSQGSFRNDPVVIVESVPDLSGQNDPYKPPKTSADSPSSSPESSRKVVGVGNKNDAGENEYSYDDAHSSNSHRFYTLQGLAGGTGPDDDTQPLSLGEIVASGIVGLNAQSRLSAEKEFVSTELFRQFVDAVRSKGFFRQYENHISSGDLTKMSDVKRKFLEREYRERYHKVVAKFRVKLAAREMLLASASKDHESVVSEISPLSMRNDDAKQKSSQQGRVSPAANAAAAAKSKLKSPRHAIIFFPSSSNELADHDTQLSTTPLQKLQQHEERGNPEADDVEFRKPSPRVVRIQAPDEYDEDDDNEALLRPLSKPSTKVQLQTQTLPEAQMQPQDQPNRVEHADDDSVVAKMNQLRQTFSSPSSAMISTTREDIDLPTVAVEKATLSNANNMSEQPQALQTLMSSKSVNDEKTAEQHKTAGNRHMQARQYDLAVESYTSALHLSPSGPNSHIYYSNRSAAYLSLKRYHDAIRDGQTALRLKPDYGKPHSRLGWAYYNVGEYQLAMDAYAQAIVSDPNNADSHRNFYQNAKIKLQQKEQTHPRQEGGDSSSVTVGGKGRVSPPREDHSVVSIPHSLSFHTNVSLRGSGEEEEHDGGMNDGPSASYGVEVREKVLRQKEADRLKGRGNSYMANREYDLAERSYTSAIDICPDGPSSYVYLSNRAAARCYLERYREAEEDAERSLRLNPTYGKAHARLGLSRFFLGDYGGAILAYEDALRLEPNNRASLSYLAKARAKRKEKLEVEESVPREH